MDKLLKLEKYQLLHNSIYWCGMIGIFILGFFTADTYVTEVMGPTEEIVSSLADIFNGMVYDSTFLLIIMSAILALILGQEFSKRTINLEVSAGHSRKQIFTSKIISYLIAFNLMALVYPVSGCIREFMEKENNNIIFTIENPMSDSSEIDCNRLFDRFYTGDKSRHNRSTGLGLAVVKTLVAILGGNIVAKVHANINLDITIIFPTSIWICQIFYIIPYSQYNLIRNQSLID